MSDDYTNLQNPDSDYTDSTNAASPYSGKTSKKPAPKPALKKPANGEVTILATYNWDPPISGKTEIEYLLSGKWHPGTLDYIEIAGPTKTSPGNFTALLGMIVEYAPGSIKRLNFFTHANKKVIGIIGTMDDKNVYFTESVDETEISNNATNTIQYTFNGQSFYLTDVQARFTDDATFVLYGCDIAFDPTTLLTALKDLLNVTVIGFKDKTVFCPPSQTIGGTVFNRSGEKMGIMKKDFKCGTDSTTDWRSLINNPNAVKVTK